VEPRIAHKRAARAIEAVAYPMLALRASIGPRAVRANPQARQSLTADRIA